MIEPRVTKFGTHDDLEAPGVDFGSERSMVKVAWLKSECLSIAVASPCFVMSPPLIGGGIKR